jgi:FSR family fosmidomycin resistance protein-like MFS transporter
MATETIQLRESTEDSIQTGQILTIASGHFIHDIYTAFVAPLLPVLMEKMSLSLTLAGSLTAILQFPAVLNPFIGYLADRVSLRYFVILAPAITGTLISLIGFAPNYLSLAIILFVTGISVAAFHAPAPAMIGRVSGKKIGAGMSLFMAGGELGRTVGPLLAVWAVSTWTLDGFYRTAVLSWVASLLLFLRFRNIPARPEKTNSIRQILPHLRTLFLPLLFIVLFRNFMAVSLAIYLPTFMSASGSNLMIAGGSLAILEFAGVGGALTSGTISDRLGRKATLIGATVLSTVFLLLFLNVAGWLLVPTLLALGFTALSSGPILLAIVQEHLPDHRAVGNGIYMFISFLLRPISILLIGLVGDHLGLQSAYLWSALLGLLAIPAILTLPSIEAG